MFSFSVISVISANSKVISCIIKWSWILANFAYSWLAQTWFTRPYLRVSTPQMLNDGLFGASVMSQRKRRFSRQIFAQTDEFDVHFHMTSQYTHLISRRFLLAADNAMDVYFCVISVISFNLKVISVNSRVISVHFHVISVISFNL